MSQEQLKAFPSGKKIRFFHMQRERKEGNVKPGGLFSSRNIVMRAKLNRKSFKNYT